MSRQATKYPTLPFTSQDVAFVYQEVTALVSNPEVRVLLRPTPKDPGRMVVVVTAFRKQLRIGEEARIELKRYVAGDAMGSLDREIHRLLYEITDAVEVASGTWGKFTELDPAWSARHR